MLWYLTDLLRVMAPRQRDHMPREITAQRKELPDLRCADDLERPGRRTVSLGAWVLNEHPVRRAVLWTSEAASLPHDRRGEPCRLAASLAWAIEEWLAAGGTERLALDHLDQE